MCVLLAVSSVQGLGGARLWVLLLGHKDAYALPSSSSGQACPPQSLEEKVSVVTENPRVLVSGESLTPHLGRRCSRHCARSRPCGDRHSAAPR